MRADPTRLLEIARIQIPPIGFYDAPDPSPFEPLAQPPLDTGVCVFAFFERWLKGETLHLTKENFGCRGAGRSLCSVATRSPEELVNFLVDQEGLKASHALMELWLEHDRPYRQKHEHILIGPLRPEEQEYLRSVTFWVNPDQLALLMLGAQYHSKPSDPPPVLAPFGSGCRLLVGAFEDLDRPQAVVGATDIAMRQYVPPEILALTVTRAMFEQLCVLDERSFLHKPFWKRLMKARAE